MTQLDSAQVMPAMTANIEITAVKALDVRFPTSHSLAGSDAMNLDPDYSAAYVIIETDGGVPVFGYSTAFTIGRGNDVQCAAVEALAPSLVGRRLSEVLADLGEVGRRLTHDSQFRWLGPEKGVMHMAIGAVLNALWDLRAKLEGKPLWRLLGELTPTETIDLIDFRYLSDALLPHEAFDLLEAAAPGKSARTAELLQFGYPAYTTAPGWLGYSDTKMVGLIREALAEGFTQIKLKVGGALADDVRRMALAREVCGPNIRIAVDANQRWDVEDAVTWIRALQPYNPHWVEEPTSTDDILGHAEIARRVAPTRIATGEQVANRVVFKQMLQARSLSVLQMDAARVAGVNENVAILLLAAKFGVPVCPHAGGVGLCEMVRHLSFFDYVAVSGSMDGRVIEYVDSLHEHFVDPALVRNGRYIAPEQPGFSTTMLQTSVERHIFTSGEVWTTPHPTTREGHHVI